MVVWTDENGTLQKRLRNGMVSPARFKMVDGRMTFVSLWLGLFSTLIANLEINLASLNVQVDIVRRRLEGIVRNRQGYFPTPATVTFYFKHLPRETKNLLFTFHSIKTVPMTGKEQKLHPKDKANFFSRATLWWIFGLLWKGNTKPLEEDLYSVRNDDGAEHLTKRLQTIWNNEKSSASSLQRKPQFWKALLRFFTWKEYGFIVFTGSLYIIAANVVWYSTIKLLQCIGSSLHNDVPRERSFVYVYGMATGQLVSSISVNHFHLYGAVLGIRARAAVVGLLHKKVSLHLRVME